ncbi:MAG: rhodanese-like domain-containing protein [Deltaproteobacteria bacterium]
MKRALLIIFAVLLIAAPLSWGDEAPVPANEKHRTTLGKYITPGQAYLKWKQSPGKVKFLDTRTPEEYYFVGHPDMAINVPLMFATGTLNPATQKPILKKNDTFVADVKKRFKPDDMIVVFCRSGLRAAMAANALAKEGYKNVYSLLGGFEGDKIKDKGSYYHGKRLKNGWKNAGVPWTYELKEELIYQPPK